MEIIHWYIQRVAEGVYHDPLLHLDEYFQKGKIGGVEFCSAHENNFVVH